MSGLSVRDDSHPEGDTEISRNRTRPGERLYEELLISENLQPKIHERIIRASETMFDWDDLERALVALSGHPERGNSGEALDILCALVREYVPLTGSSAIQAMARVRLRRGCSPSLKWFKNTLARFHTIS